MSPPAPKRHGPGLAGLVSAFRGRRVAVLGDLIADEFYYGDISRISREAPVLVLEHRRTVSVPGGAGNSVANLCSLGARPLPVGIVGRDEAGNRLIASFREMGVSTSGILRVPEYQTPTKSRIMAGGLHTRRQQIVRLDRGAARSDLPHQLRSRLSEALGRALERSSGLLVADYGYGAATPQLVNRLLPRLERRGLPVTVDSRGRVAEFRGVTACTPNQEEVEVTLGLSRIHDEQAIDAAGRRLLRQTRNQAVLITCGPRGMSLFLRRKPMLQIEAYGSGEVADVTGAGDTVIAAFTLAIVSGGTLEEAARLANRAAGVVVTKAGTATVSLDELAATVDGGTK